MKGNLVRQMELAAGGLLVLTPFEARWHTFMSLSVFLGLQGPPGWSLVSFGNLFLTLGAF